MSVTNSVEQYSSSISQLDKKDYQPLTRSHLFLLNLKNESSKSPFDSNSSYSNYNYTKDKDISTTTTTTVTEMSENENSSSSSSSLASFDTQSKDFQEASRYFNGSSKDTSTSSIATLVQRKLSMSGSNSTLNLQPKALQNELLFKTSHSEPSSPSENGNVSTSTTPRKIKSSLKLPSLTRSKSMPTTEQKTVRFSSILTKVKTFDEHAKPSSISLDNTPEYSPLHDDDDYFNQHCPKAFFDLKNNISDDSDSDDSEKDYFSFKPQQQSKWSIKCLNFNLLCFSSNSPLESKVKLNSLCISKNSSLIGTVDVENIAFEKYVEIKFTTDDWKSIFLVTGTYDRSITSTIDRFKFEINLNQFLLLGNSKNNLKGSKVVSIGLCVRYTAGNSQSFYDNNNSQDFKFELINQQKIPRRSIASLSRSSSSTSISSTISRKSSVLSPTRNNFTHAISTTTTTITKPSSSSSSSTRYFSDDRDYFNHNNSVVDPQSTSEFTTSSRSSSPYSSIPQASSSNSFLSSKSSFGFFATGVSSVQEYTRRLNKDSTLSSFPTSSFPTSSSFPISKSPYNNENMSDFLKKYCFYKSEDPTLHHGAAPASPPRDIVATR